MKSRQRLITPTVEPRIPVLIPLLLGRLIKPKNIKEKLKEGQKWASLIDNDYYRPEPGSILEELLSGTTTDQEGNARSGRVTTWYLGRACVHLLSCWLKKTAQKGTTHILGPACKKIYFLAGLFPGRFQAGLRDGSDHYFLVMPTKILCFWSFWTE